MKIQKYSPEIEVKMRDFYNSLSEKDRRRYAAIEAEKLVLRSICFDGLQTFQVFKTWKVFWYVTYLLSGKAF